MTNYLRIFQSTHSRGVRPSLSYFLLSLMLNFNPRTHGECDKAVVLTKGVKVTFQSTHSRGVRLGRGDQMRKTKLFQSTHSRGVRRIEILGTLGGFNISIHALTGSATFAKDFKNLTEDDFNPRTHGECDASSFPPSPFSPSFQSTHSRGVRLIQSFEFGYKPKFQSTHSRGVRR